MGWRKLPSRRRAPGRGKTCLPAGTGCVCAQGATRTAQDTINIGSGNNTVTVTGATASTITAGNGSNVIPLIGGSGNTLTIGYGNDTLVASSEHNDTITAG